MATARVVTLLLGVVLAFAAGKGGPPPPPKAEVAPAKARELADRPCVVVSEVSVSVPCPCEEGDNGITLGFTLTNGRRHHPVDFPSCKIVETTRYNQPSCCM